MDRIIVEGGRRLAGSVTVGGAKNAALPILASSILTNGVCEYHNVPELKDINSIKELLTHIGARISCQGNTIQVDASGINNHEAPYEIVRKMRASILVLCPLVARLGRARVSLPGGCAIGARPINFHLSGLETMGAEITLEHGYVDARAEKLTGGNIFFDVPSVTGTENLLMAAVLAEGVTRIRNAAREPEVKALADVLVQMGADIKGAGTSDIIVTGVTTLNPVSATIIPDRIETGTFMVGAALTGSDITIENTEPAHLEGQIDKLQQTGAKIAVNGTAIRVEGTDVIKSVDVKTLPYPGFPTDMQAQFMVLMAVARGLSVITETIFENRFIHVSELLRMGADITISGNAAMIGGVPSLSGAPVMASDLRASASLVLAGLVATGKTEINRVYHLDRGYEKLEEKFEQLGAAIKRVR
ncbi:MAG: UDP-N-acetylglucosamine 1-carboxyvinyltransferase [Thermodesulfobacteriota bacterium]|nr:UDP-N-acetylglucosamine 1-carboxyvinyltransferase [Thermodesulfobacteriota bacterium]